MIKTYVLRIRHNLVLSMGTGKIKTNASLVKVAAQRRFDKTVNTFGIPAFERLVNHNLKSGVINSCPIA